MVREEVEGESDLPVPDWASWVVGACYALEIGDGGKCAGGSTGMSIDLLARMSARQSTQMGMGGVIVIQAILFGGLLSRRSRGGLEGGGSSWAKAFRFVSGPFLGEVKLPDMADSRIARWMGG